MSKKQFKAPASSSRVGFGQPSNPFGASSSSSPAFGSGGSPLSYLAEQPDLAPVSDPNVVVSFKNLSKKDSTTKAKALEELQSWITAKHNAGEPVENAFLDAWVKVYPRISIDVSRRVRQLAHTVHGQTCISAGKRVARHMPAVVGAWLAGLHDSDKVVARAAQDAFQQVFSSPEKQANLSKIYQSSIVSFARDAVLKESPSSLSDERTTSKEDSEAKYNRVISGNIFVINDLLIKLDPAEIEKCRDTYDQIFAEKTLWAFISSKDVQLRRSIMRLFRTCIEKHQHFVTPYVTLLKEAFLSKATLRHQTGSSVEFTETLVVLARSIPSFWEDYGKTSVFDRVESYLKQGSQSGPAHFWDRIAILFSTMPTQGLDLDADRAQKILESLQTGIIRKDELRSSLESAWSCYFTIADQLVQRIDPDGRLVVLQNMVLPIVRQAVRPNQEDAAWFISGPKAIAIAAKALSITDFEQVASESWVNMAIDIVERVQTSLPEQSKDYITSQDAVRTEVEKWFALQKHALSITAFEPLVDSTTYLILNKACEQVKTRNGKPYGAAAAINAALVNIGSFINAKERLRDLIASFVASHIHDEISTPSGPFLISILYYCQDFAEFENAWSQTLKVILHATDEQWRDQTLRRFLDPKQLPSGFKLAVQSEDLQHFVLEQVHRSVNGVESYPLFVANSSSSSFLSDTTRDQALADLTANLHIEGHSTSALAGLDAIVKGNKQLLKPYLTSPDGAQLIQNLLRSMDSKDVHEAEVAATINTSIQAILSTTSGPTNSIESMLAVIEQGLYDAGSNSVSIHTLADEASKLVSTRNDIEAVAKFLPDADKWLEALAPFATASIPRSLAITNSLGGSLYLVGNDEFSASSASVKVSRDSDGFPVALRIAFYLLKVFGQQDVQTNISKEAFQKIYSAFGLAVQLASDELSLAGANGLWKSRDVDTDEEMTEFVSAGQRLLKEWVKSKGKDSIEKVDAACQFIKSKCLGTGPLSFHMSRLLANTVSTVLDEGKVPNSLVASDLDTELKELRKDGNIILLTAYMTAYSTLASNSTYLSRTCNEIIANLTGLDVETESGDALKQLVILNAILKDYDHLIETIAKQRLIFYIKHVVPWLESTSIHASLKSELCKSLVLLLPAMADIYGEHWQNQIDGIMHIWSNLPSESSVDATLPLYQSTLKLFNVLGSLVSDEDTNEDLKDAWKEAGESLSDALLSLLVNLAAGSDVDNQPLRVVNELLARQISAAPPRKIGRLDELYGLMVAESSAVQRTAYDILHRQIPLAQEQISLDAALDNKIARLPEELLSLILESPPVSYDSASFERAMPPAIRTYLSSWLLVFDHFRRVVSVPLIIKLPEDTNTDLSKSDKVKSDYSDHLKDGGHLDTLLLFIFTFLGHASGRPIDASKFDVATYGFDLQESPTKDVQWLLSHLYFLCLQYLPSLTKAWWLDSKSRQIRVNVESWTEKYISPHIISTTLDAVAQWAAKEDATSDEAFIIKVNQRAREVRASKEIDDQLLTISINLPPTFPLGQAVVESVSRVAVDEKKWNSWLLNCTGVIAFSNNSLIDGIIAFRRNVNGALKGQTECAICYSLVSGEKQLPTKKCGTCKNAFHGSCLYRWFKSSNSSSCPLCRTSFNYS
ncbi:hypothetical protein FH972_022932 [Carpinus fangiana]|uniref:E3 ubiquitin-protein ligase listerin n=1 Tax=Carpinus fangiana TaxID=176857 RepID=A0A5N6KU68_9ROSI|nr:hypothetical protein FH972_022932 [Carpinus fangiana]